MKRYFLMLIIFGVCSINNIYPQFNGMSEDELRKKAAEMGYNVDDLPNRNSAVPQVVQDVEEQNPAPVEIPKPENKSESSFKVHAFSDNESIKDLKAYGYNIFTHKPTTFEPSLNIPVPPNYIVGPGDEINITLFGETQLVYNLTISNNGDIYIPNVGPVNVSGLNLTGLKNKLYRVLSQKYSSMDVNSNGGSSTNLDISTGKLRTVKVYVLGEVTTPGGYTLPSLSTSFTALYYCGGPTINGTLRNIQVLRNGKVISEIDLYNYLIAGDKTKDIRLEDEDIIFVPPVGKRTAIYGNAFRSAIYELKDSDKLKNLLSYAGGLKFNAYYERIHIERVIPFDERKDYLNNILSIDLNFSSVDELKNSEFKIEDGDVVNIPGVNRLPENRVRISGYVKKPGVYELSENLMTVRDLIIKADTLLPEAFLSKAILVRTLPSEKKEIISFDLQKAMANDPLNNLVLQNKDEVEIYNEEQFHPTRSVEIAGAVKNPGSFTRFERMTLTELIIKAGGLTEAATTKNIEITRLDTLSNEIYSQKLTVNLPKDYWLKDKKNDFMLEDFDRVLVKNDPAKNFEQKVSLQGEVQFPGTYSLLHKDEKVYDLIKRAGGFEKTAYKDGIYIKRNNPNFLKAQRILVPDSLLFASGAGQPIYDQKLFVDEYSNRIPIIWEDIENDTSSIYNLTLQPGDQLVVPKDPDVVYVSGAVIMPSSVPYKEGAGLSYYIYQAGGYLTNAAEGDEVVVLPNGQKWESSGWFFIPDKEISSGSTIVVPAEIQKNFDAWPVVRDIVSVVSGAAVLILTVTNLTK